MAWGAMSFSLGGETWWIYKCFVGYGISDFSLYSGRPHNYHGLPNNDNHTTHSVFLGTAYKF